jgi:hypothetical protein
MIVDPMARLRAANPEPSTTTPSIDAVWAKLEGHADRDRTSSGRSLARKPRIDRRRVAGVLTMVGSSAVVIVVAAVLFTTSGSRTHEAAPGAQHLIARLAVLRRPQTSPDRLPHGLHFLRQAGVIVPDLTRLVRTFGKERIYLVVATPDARSNPIWSPRLGDQAALVAVSGHNAAESIPVPALDLDDADEVALLSPTPALRPTHHPGVVLRSASARYVGLVPDGVTRVRWTFPDQEYRPGAIVEATVKNNVAVESPPASSTIGGVLNAVWLNTAGRKVSTSNDALLSAEAAQNAQTKRVALRLALQHSGSANPALLSAFAVFSVTSRTGRPTAGGYIVSHPRPQDLPIAALQRSPRTPSLDYNEVREVRTSAGEEMFLIPGARSMCLVAGNPRSPFPDDRVEGGGGETCDPASRVRITGIGISGYEFGRNTIYRIVPKTISHIQVRINGHRMRVRVPEGVYLNSEHRRPGD